MIDNFDKAKGTINIGYDEHIPIEQIQDLVLKLRYNPDLYIKEVLGVKYLGSKMQQAIRRIPFHKKTFIRAGHGISKSFACAALIPWFLETYPDSLVYTTAPTARQVSEVLWKEVYKHRSNSLYPIAGKSLSNKLKISDSWQAYGFTSSQAVAYQGMHAKYLLWILDEADGIKKEIWEAINSTLTGTENRLIAIGNPVDPDSEFREEQEKNPDDVIVIPSYESPNIITQENDKGEIEYIADEIAPGCATLDWILQMEKEWGKNSNVFMSRVQGEYPSGSADALIGRDQVLAADAVMAMPASWFVIGVDVAYDGDDESVITALSGNAFYGKLIRVKGMKGEELAQKVMEFIREIEDNETVINSNGVEENMKCKVIIYDASGVATAFSEFIYKEVEKARRIDIHLQPIDFAEKVTSWRVEAKENDMHLVLNKRAEMYLDLRRLVVNSELYIPKAYNVHNLFPKIKYFINKQGLFQIESKQEFKKKNKGKSPDVPDSMILAAHAKVLRLHLLGKSASIIQ